ncbi:MAG: hypothetical protein ACM3NP_12125 [Actinomycetota bacterium]
MKESNHAVRRSSGPGKSGLKALLGVVMTALSLTPFSENITVSGKVIVAET